MFNLARGNISLLATASLAICKSAPEAKTNGNPLSFASVTAKTQFRDAKRVYPVCVRV